MPKITAAQLAAAFEGYARQGWGYVFTGQGQTWSAELAKSWASARRAVPSGKSSATYFTQDCAKWLGRRVADCSGGIVYTIQQFDPKFGDHSANSFKSSFVRSGPISTLPEVPGLALWKSGHIGVYIGGGKAAEFMGTAYGCVITKVKDRPWTHWGELVGVEYGSALAEKPAASIPAAVQSPAASSATAKLRVTGESVNIRASADATLAPLGVAHKGEELPLLKAGTDWHMVEWCGKQAFISAKYASEVV
ncbi:MAG: hypothetical protein LBD02_04465 [Christensenellaceae bacterium]|jgi:hypothetical protein|nr:hypothetical protein [Christensenellaceae bacterium]